MTPSLLSALQLGYPGAVAAAAAVQGQTTATPMAAAVIPEEEEEGDLSDPDFAADLSMYYRPDAPSALEEIHKRSLSLEKEEKEDDSPRKSAPGKNSSADFRNPPDPPSALRFEI